MIPRQTQNAMSVCNISEIQECKKTVRYHKLYKINVIIANLSTTLIITRAYANVLILFNVTQLNKNLEKGMYIS